MSQSLIDLKKIKMIFIRINHITIVFILKIVKSVKVMITMNQLIFRLMFKITKL